MTIRLRKPLKAMALYTLTACALASAALCAGCNILGPAGYFIAGPEKIKPVYQLPPDRATVIFVDDRSSRVPTRTSRELIGTTAEQTILASGVIKDMVQSRLVLAAVKAERFGTPMTIAEVGQAVKADIVIYATVDQFALSTDGQTFAPEASLRVKVIDAKSDARLWPADSSNEGTYRLSIKLPPQQGELPTSAQRLAAEQAFARLIGDRLGKLFYEHTALDEQVKLDWSPGRG